MTISSQTRKAGPYSGTGSTGPFSFSFKVFEASDVLVVKLDTGTKAETTLTMTTDYTVSLNADQNANPGGTITLTSALSSTYKIVISSQVPYLQETDLTNQGGFYPEVITDALDKLTIEVQQLVETSARQLTYPITDPSSSIGDLPSAGDRANQYLAFDANGNPIATLEIPEYIYQGPHATDPSARTDGTPLQTGDLYFNTGTSRMRVYGSGVWVDVGVPIPLSITPQSFSGNGSTSVFTLSTEPAFPAAVDVYISGVAQKYTTDYSISGTTLTFVSPPPTGTNNIYVKILSAYAGGVPNDGSVTTIKIADSAVTTEKIHDDNVTTAKIADANVTTAKIADANVTPAKLSAGHPSWNSSGYLTTTVGGGAQSQYTSQMIYIENADRTANNVITAQGLLGSAAGVSVNLLASTRYEFEIVLLTSKTAALACSMQIAFGGTATLSSVQYTAISKTAGASATVAAAYEMQTRLTSGFSTLTTVSVASAAAASATEVIIRGTIDVNGAGTLLPRFAFNAAPTVGTVKAGTRMTLSPIGATGASTNIGGWA